MAKSLPTCSRAWEGLTRVAVVPVYHLSSRLPKRRYHELRQAVATAMRLRSGMWLPLGRAKEAHSPPTYIARLRAYKAQGMNEKQAEEQAHVDIRKASGHDPLAHARGS